MDTCFVESAQKQEGECECVCVCEELIVSVMVCVFFFWGGVSWWQFAINQGPFLYTQTNTEKLL